MTKNYLLIIVSIFFMVNNYAQSFYGAQADKILKGSSEIHRNEKTDQIDYVAFREGKQISEDKFEDWVKRYFQLSDNTSLIEINRITDKNNQTHIRYKLSFDSYKVHDAMLIAHINNNMVYAINGNIQIDAQGSYSASLSESDALQKAIDHINATKYKWEIPSENNFLKTYTGDNEASFYPVAKYEIIKNKNTNTYRLAYIFDIYAQEPMSRQDVYVDANNGEILFVNKTIHHADVGATAATKYSGLRDMITDSFNGSFRLRESGRGLGIETYDLNNATTYSGAVDFIDTDNYWNNINTEQDEIAADAHWGMEMTYDYYFVRHNRNSIDGNGFKLVSYVHYDNNYVNAFWNGQFMTFGDGNTTYGPLVALDIVGHEITHGLTSNTANLDYQDESGAMNEAFSDIFGNSIEAYAKPNVASWELGEDIGVALRDMSNPKLKGDPDTYLGTNYYIGTADNGGVHTNSGVLNYIYYLMSDGGIGTNDNNDAYNVNGVSIDTAGAIAFRTLTVYLTNTSNYADARFYFIKSAIDLYGACSNPVKTTTNAFYAAGIGAAYQAGVSASFSAEVQNFCQPTATVNFSNLSNNGISFIWDFGDGSTSTAFNPTHDYLNFGSYAVKLITDGGSCGADTTQIDGFISVDASNPCISYMPSSGSQTITTCMGTLYDDGGTGEYSDNTNVTTTLSPTGATSVTLNFTQFGFESGYDYLKIYDGPTSSSTLIGSYDGNNLPNGGTITSTGGSITLVQQTDQMVTDDGFVASWQCQFVAAAPVSAFSTSDTNNCTGMVSFTNSTINGPTSYLWDFGDGNTSTMQNPTHNYTLNGIYTVSLSTSNAYGSDQLTKTNYIIINKPSTPSVQSVSQCNTGSVQLSAYANGLVKWFASQTSNTLLDTGVVFTTPNLSQTTSYWVENAIEKVSQTGGMTATTTNGGILAYDQGLIFDVYKSSKLISVKVYTLSSGNTTIKLLNSGGTTLQSKNVSLVSGWNTVILDFDLPIANDLQLQGKDLWRHNSGINYPYTIPGILSINKSSASSTPLNYYYYFYEWEVKENACYSDRVEITAFINTAAPVADFTISNNDPYVSFTNNSQNNGNVNWDFGDQLTNDNQNPNHLFINNGTFDVKLTVNNGCGVSSKTKSVTIGLATAINSVEDDFDNKLFPNPNDGSFNVSIDGKANYNEFEIYNSIGLLVYKSTIAQGQTNLELDIRNLSSGMYLIKLKSDDIISNLKFIKQ